MYRGISAKNCSRNERGQSETRVHLESLAFFLNIKNEQHLFSLFLTYLCWRFCTAKSTANTGYQRKWNVQNFIWMQPRRRLVFHALQQKINIVLYSKDTDVLVSMVFVYALKKINEKWNISELTSQQVSPNSCSHRAWRNFFLHIVGRIKVSQ